MEKGPIRPPVTLEVEAVINIGSLEFARRRNGFIFPKSTIVALLEDALGDIKMTGENARLIFTSIADNIYQGGKKDPQLFYWQKSLTAMLKVAKVPDVDKVIINFTKSLEDLKKTK